MWVMIASVPGLCILFTHYRDNTQVYFIPPYTPLLYSKTGVYRGIQFFLFITKTSPCNIQQVFTGVKTIIFI